MSGNIEVRGESGFGKSWGGVKLWSERNLPQDTSELPRFCRLLLKAEDGTDIAMTDPRRFGRIRLAKDPVSEAPISSLGPDPLEEFPSVSKLRETLRSKRSPIKSVLLDQSVFAGVGNWIADEILFQARISPHRSARSLSPTEIKRLRTRTLGIIRKAVDVNADYERFPKSWLFHDRWGKPAEAYTSRGFQIQHDTIGGRTTAWVPALQK